MAGQGFLTTHILDTARGVPAAGVQLHLYRIENGQQVPVSRAITNADGRTDAPLIAKGDLTVGTYEIVFQIGAYFQGYAPASAQPFLDIVPIRFGIDDAESHYHVPLLASPFGFSTYRGS
ncbi:MAG: hydroxyisourate hydrolase [Pseudomonadota bacterium]